VLGFRAVKIPGIWEIVKVHKFAIGREQKIW
jgi:hypothetical protein